MGPVLSEPLPIAGYDLLTAAEVMKEINRLSAGELAVVAAHERATKGRITVLKRLDRLTAGTTVVPAGDDSDDVVVDLRDDPAGTCLLCEQPIGAFAEFSAHLKTTHGLKEDPGFE